jgi:hypothetical protein
MTATPRYWGTSEPLPSPAEAMDLPLRSLSEASAPAPPGTDFDDEIPF